MNTLLVNRGKFKKKKIKNKRIWGKRKKARENRRRGRKSKELRERDGYLRSKIGSAWVFD